MARDDGDGAELAHRARVGEQHAGEQRPFHVGQRDGEEDLEPARAERQRRLLLGRSLLLHERDQLARDEREGDEQRREHDARHGEDDLDVDAAASHGPNRPCAPNRSTKTRPETTGDTENGRSIRVMSTFLPRNSNFAIAQAAQRPKAALSGTTIAATVSVRQDRGARVGIGERREIAVQALARRLDRDDERAARAGTGSGSRPSRRSASSAPARASSAASAPRAGASATSDMAEAPAGPALRRVDREQHDEGQGQHDRGDRGRAGVVVFLELHDDQQRRDLGDVRARCRR